MATNVEIHQTVRAIGLSLDETIAFYETYAPSAQNPALIERVNQCGLHPAFNVISDALHRETIIGLCRIWDEGRGTATLKHLAGKFSNARVLADLKSAGRSIDATALGKWVANVDAGRKLDELSALQVCKEFLGPSRQLISLP
jgi:hypothetical protein